MPSTLYTTAARGSTDNRQLVIVQSQGREAAMWPACAVLSQRCHSQPTLPAAARPRLPHRPPGPQPAHLPPRAAAAALASAGHCCRRSMLSTTNFFDLDTGRLGAMVTRSPTWHCSASSWHMYFLYWRLRFL